tara:strand:- start:89 stop:832 length:744 start_codon:yes stop_codon:yes gene_type:complete
MLIENKYGQVDFWPNIDGLNPKAHGLTLNHKRIGLSISGGCDSALLLFYMCKVISEEKKDVTIVPFTGIDITRPTNIWNVEEIITLMKEKFPKVNIENVVTFEYTTRTSTNERCCKKEAHKEAEREMLEEGLFTIMFGGRTANPTYDEAKKHNLLEKRELARDRENPDISNSEFAITRLLYRPWIEVDKRWIAAEYHKNNLMDDLYPITASCIGREDATEFFTKPCKTCWWCREKVWAFGSYDGGIK